MEIVMVWFGSEPGFEPEPNLSYLGLISTKNQITRVLVLVQLFTDLNFNTTDSRFR